jgi:glutaredoxin domain-containing cysteine-rich protein 1
VINSWELMAGLDASTPSKSAVLQSRKLVRSPGKENAHRALRFPPCGQAYALREISAIRTQLPWQNNLRCYSLEAFEKRCPPDGAQAAVLYTTTLRGIRKTFEDCNAVRAALEGLGVWIRERDVSMDMGFREELRHLMKGSA